MIRFTKTSLALLTGTLAIATSASVDAQMASPGATAPAASATPTAAPTGQAGAAGTVAAPTGPNPTVGGAPMDATKPIATNASAAPNLTTLVKAVTAADLVETLSGPGPFTVFAPTNDAFGRLAPGTVDTLLKPEAKATLAKVLTYHVVPGTITSEQLKQQITAGGGSATLKTVEGETLTAKMMNGGLALTDVHGNISYIQTPDVRQSNGIVHVVNGVMLPTLD